MKSATRTAELDQKALDSSGPNFLAPEAFMESNAPAFNKVEHEE